MPYQSKRIYTTEGCKRLELSYLFRQKCINKDSNCSAILSWDLKGENKGSLRIQSFFNESDNKYIKLTYTVSNSYTNQSRELEYKINLIPVKSNLGIGNVYYFQCPVTLRKCKILYLAYDSEIFKSRFAYRQRIYYVNQSCSKLFYASQRVWKIKPIIESLEKTRMKTTYRGRESRTYKRYMRLKEKLNHYEILILYKVSMSLSKMSKKI